MNWKPIYHSLSFLCLILLTAGCSPKAPQPEPVQTAAVLTTVKMNEPTTVYKNGENVADNVHIRWAYNTLGVNIRTKWSAPAEDYDMKLRLMLSSGDVLPDVFTSNVMDTVNTFMLSGKLLDAGEAWERYASPTWKAAMAEVPEAWKPFEINGKRMAIPIITEQASQSVLWIRKDWLEHLNLKAPDNLKELETVMNAFTYDDPDGNGIQDTYGIDFAIKDQYVVSPIGDISWVFGAYGAIPSIWSKNEKGQLVYGSVQPQIKQALATLKTWKRKGYIGNNLALQDFSQVNQNIIDGKVGIVAGPRWFSDYPFQQLKAKDPSAEFVPYPIPVGKDGTAARLKGNSYSGALMISRHISEEALQAFFRYQNYLYEATVTNDPLYLSAYQNGYDYVLTPDGSLDNNSNDIPGGKVQTFKYTLMGQYASYPSRIRSALLKMGQGETLSSHDRAILLSMGIDPKDETQFLSMQADAVENQQRQIDRSNLFQGPPTKTMQARNTYLQKIELENFNSIIYGEEPLAAFDEFVQKWMNSGGRQITKEVNEWYQSTETRS
ncbi:extracellular solute-binding protein [Paenibacillus barcinonensis]|uniref:extracellular solute-binding protein n=1 Tax=Paenibacillus barcinonensis TaxID=198119 RepID=UPI001C11391B|nr:extracellular solute-binding protein [Paenibacillus barcinonensis]MBU5351875.1 extracellular solute-binding protein [Paenibacillus barcinonensis]